MRLVQTCNHSPCAWLGVDESVVDGESGVVSSTSAVGSPIELILNVYNRLYIII